ncbi:MAG: NYN domain-containing protein [Acidimicrobiales bacterium]
MRWLVDGMNVLASRPDGWWRDRAAARRRLVAELAAMHRRTGEPVVVVFDGRLRAEEVEEGELSGLEVRFAGVGPGAADDVIAALAASEDDPSGTTVVTSDAGLRRRVVATGVAVVGAGAFRRRLGASGH